jgi:tetratricopeptide (TPR) repeat protein
MQVFRHLTYILAIIGFSFIITPMAVDILAVNAWSLDFVGITLSSKMHPAVFDAHPSEHSRAPIWLAQKAITEADLQQAKIWIPILEQKQSDFLTAHVLGQVYWGQGKSDIAVQTWLGIRDYQAIEYAAREAENGGQFANAMLAYQAAIFINPESGTLPLANYLELQNNPAAAEGLLRKSLQQYANAEQALDWQLLLGEILRDGERWNEALDHYENILNENPNDMQGHIGLGWAIYDSGAGFDMAEIEFQQAISLAPDQGDGSYAIGQALIREERFNEADPWLADAIQREPNERWWQLTRANAARSAGNIVLAFQLYTDLAGRYPDWSGVYYELAWAYKMTKRPEAAIQSMRQAISLAQLPDGWYYYRCGQIYESQGEYSNALEAYIQASVWLPNNQHILNTINRLQTSETSDSD